METYSKDLAANVENILAALDDGVYVTDREGNTLYVNEMYEKLTGLKRSEVLGLNVRTLKEKGVFDFVANPVVVETLEPVTNVQVLKSGKRVVAVTDYVI